MAGQAAANFEYEGSTKLPMLEETHQDELSQAQLKWCGKQEIGCCCTAALHKAACLQKAKGPLPSSAVPIP